MIYTISNILYIFKIFFSNTGDKEILDITYDVWFDGFQREDVTLEDFFSHIKEAAYNTKGELLLDWKSYLKYWF